MPRSTFKGILDFSDRTMKRKFLAGCGTLTGMYRVELSPARETRSLKQNAAYWALVVQPFYEFLREQSYEISDPTEAHEMLRAKFLAKALTQPDTGEVIGWRVRSTTELSVEEFSDYVERARAWLWDKFAIETVDPDPDYAAAGAGAGKGGARC